MPHQTTGGDPMRPLQVFAREIVSYRGRLVPRHVAISFEEQICQSLDTVLAIGDRPAVYASRADSPVLGAEEAWSLLVSDLNVEHPVYRAQ